MENSAFKRQSLRIIDALRNKFPEASQEQVIETLKKIIDGLYEETAVINKIDDYVALINEM